MKIICVGMSKTGTTSIKKALEILGYNVMSWSDRAAQLYSKRRFDLLYTDYMENYDAFTDRPFTMLYKIFDTIYDDCKFIFTERNDEPWYQSLYNHVSSSEKSKLNFSYIYPHKIEEKAKLIEYKTQYELSVYEYFSPLTNNYKNIVFMDIFNGDGWEKLCNFLDREIPDVDFPHANKGKEFNEKYKKND